MYCSCCLNLDSSLEQFYSLSKYLLSTYFMPGTVYGTWDATVKKWIPNLDEFTTFSWVLWVLCKLTGHWNLMRPITNYYRAQGIIWRFYMVISDHICRLTDANWLITTSVLLPSKETSPIFIHLYRYRRRHRHGSTYSPAVFQAVRKALGSPVVSNIYVGPYLQYREIHL